MNQVQKHSSENKYLFDKQNFFDQSNERLQALTEPGGVISIHFPFNIEKTYFSKLYTEYFKEQYNVAILNAFAHDDNHDPFILLHQIINKVTSQNDCRGETKSFLQAGNKICIQLLSWYLSAGLNNVGLWGVNLNDELDILTKDSLAKQIEKYKRQLSEYIKENNKKIVILVDELDKCSTNFALTLLERIKYYFDIPGLLFVLMLNAE